MPSFTRPSETEARALMSQKSAFSVTPSRTAWKHEKKTGRSRAACALPLPAFRPSQSASAWMASRTCGAPTSLRRSRTAFRTRLRSKPVAGFLDLIARRLAMASAGGDLAFFSASTAFSSASFPSLPFPSLGKAPFARSMRMRSGMVDSNLVAAGGVRTAAQAKPCSSSGSLAVHTSLLSSSFSPSFGEADGSTSEAASRSSLRLPHSVSGSAQTIILAMLFGGGAVSPPDICRNCSNSLIGHVFTLRKSESSGSKNQLGCSTEAPEADFSLIAAATWNFRRCAEDTWSSPQTATMSPVHAASSFCKSRTASVLEKSFRTPFRLLGTTVWSSAGLLTITSWMRSTG
mmetsp:Transcript_24048/g.71565  ORF Transcript_24048/g.71565 Transcript_24048/m.71565 type:complete len:346 (+) Transcript_24048:624-1661(+)